MSFRLTRPLLRENDIEQACLDLLRWRHYWVARIHCGRFRSIDGKRWITGAEKGTPDYAVLHEFFPGFLLEVKRPGGELQPEQAQKHYEIQIGYRLAIAVVDSAAQLREWLDQHESLT